jgi:hypothetical protein
MRSGSCSGFLQSAGRLPQPEEKTKIYHLLHHLMLAWVSLYYNAQNHAPQRIDANQQRNPQFETVSRPHSREVCSQVGSQLPDGESLGERTNQTLPNGFEANRGIVEKDEGLKQRRFM